MRFFIMNKAENYAKGMGSRDIFRENHLCFGNGKDAWSWYLSDVFDSGEDGTVWHRWSASLEESDRSTWTLWIYSCDREAYKRAGKVMTKLHTEAAGFLTAKQSLQVYQREKKINQRDILLHKVKGRYLWFLLEVYNQESVPLEVSDIRIDFPKETWTSYLPSFFQEENSFLERYLSIFQTIYQNLEEKVQHREELLDAGSTDPDMLFRLAQWLGIPCINLWTIEKLRYLVKNAGRLYAIRGTRRGLEEIIRLYVDYPPLLVEQQEACRFDSQSGLCRKLYGLHGYSLTILLPKDNVKNQEDIQALRRIAESMAPSGLECRIILLYPRIQLDSYTYLGLNSVLSRTPGLCLDGTSQVSFSALER